MQKRIWYTSSLRVELLVNYLAGKGRFIFSKLITITDNGHGIPDKDLDEIFVPFYSTKSEGSGIGLSLSRQIMHLHCGEIFATSNPGESTSLNLVFYE